MNSWSRFIGGPGRWEPSVTREPDSAHRPLTAADLLPHGPLRRVGRQLLLYDTLDSTNTLLLSRAHELADGTVAHAEFQTAGRGRLGRTWVAPRGSSVLLSVLLREPRDSPALMLGGLLAAVAACEAIETVTECCPAVRWPNDIMLAGGKVGGVLAESRAVGPQRALVLGIGLNCLQQPGHFTGELAGRAISLESVSPRPVMRAAVAASLLNRLDAWLARVTAAANGWEDVRRAWQMRCDDFGRRITLAHDGRTYTGTALEISADGDIVVELDRGGRRCFSAAGTTRLA